MAGMKKRRKSIVWIKAEQHENIVIEIRSQVFHTENVVSYLKRLMGDSIKLVVAKKQFSLPEHRDKENRHHAGKLGNLAEKFTFSDHR